MNNSTVPPALSSKPRLATLGLQENPSVQSTLLIPNPTSGKRTPALDQINLLDEKRVAEVLGLPPGTLRRWRCVGEGPAYVKLGNGPKARVRYDARDIAAYVEQGKRFPIIRAGNAGRGK